MELDTRAPQSTANPPLFRELLDQPRHSLVLRLTLLLLLLHGSTTLLLDVPLRIACGVMLLSPSLLVNPVMWTIICGLVWWMNATVWLWIDNHKILITYWCLACALATSARDPDRVLAWNGRLLIGLTFLFATTWKVWAGEYWDGSFLEYTFLTDSRVAAIASAIGRIPPDALNQNRLFEFLLGQAPDTIGSVNLIASQQLQLFTRWASYWTLAIEALVASVFLVRDKQWLSRCRDWILMIFIATTYFLLPVLGFAYVLIIMGFAQCPLRSRSARMAYICLFGLLQFARLPWDIFLIAAGAPTG